MESIQVRPNGQHAALSSLAKWIIVCAFLASLVIYFDRGGQSGRRAVIINSDDAGMCSSVNKGTISVLQAGLVKSTSIMVCCPGFAEFAEFAKANPQYDYGVHLTLTCDLRAAGWGPVLPGELVPTLVGKDGFFHASTSEVAQAANLPEVEAELRAQIKKALDAGIRVTHLDHHMFVLYGRPDFLSLYVKLGIDLGLPIRFIRDAPLQMLNDHGETFAPLYASLTNELELAGLPALDEIESKNYSVLPTEKRSYFLTMLRNLSPGVTEVVIHCASPDDSGIEPPDFDARCADTRNFSSREFRDEFSKLRVEQLNWRELKTRR